jgi:hypothetical protein
MSEAGNGIAAVAMKFRELTRLMPTDSKPGKALHAGGNKGFRMETRKCFNCNEFGHLSKDCPLPDKRLARRNAQARKGHALMTAAKALGTKACIRDQLIVDSGATHHMLSRRDKLFDLRPRAVKVVEMGGGELHKVEAEGIAHVLGGPDGPVTLCGVLYVPTLNANRLSASKATGAGYSVEMQSQLCEVTQATQKGTVIIQNLYQK